MPPKAGNSILAIILGASEWPRYPGLHGSRAFYNSAQRFADYLIRDDGFGVPQQNILWLFDSELAPSEIDAEIREFLVEHLADVDHTPSDLFVYYTGHGRLSIPERKFQVILRATDKEAVAISAYRMADLANSLNRYARLLRKWIILDCCSSAAAYPDFQPLDADITDVIRSETEQVLPTTGTALICASSADQIALNPEQSDFTMFSGALLDVLETHSPTLSNPMSLQDIASQLEDKIFHDYLDKAVRPDVSCPDKRDGDLSAEPFFPNLVSTKLAGNASRCRFSPPTTGAAGGHASTLRSGHRRFGTAGWAQLRVATRRRRALLLAATISLAALAFTISLAWYLRFDIGFPFLEPSKTPYELRSESRIWTLGSIRRAAIGIGLYDDNLNPTAKGIPNDYRLVTRDDKELVIDQATRLMWQRHGSTRRMPENEVEDHIGELNQSAYAGFNQWRLPTIVEALSVMEPKQRDSDGLFIDESFGRSQRYIWTADKKNDGKRWIVSYLTGDSIVGVLNIDDETPNFFVRAVRTLNREAREVEDRLTKLAEMKAAVVVPPPEPAVPSLVEEIVGVYPKAFEPRETFKDCEACPEMVVIPAGEFVMGSPPDEEGRDDDEGDVHRVQVPSFALGKYEVTFAQWDACVADGGCNGYRPSDYGRGRGNQPVFGVSWKDAKAYAAWLSRKTTVKDYRLPSESEWEYAARAGTTTARYWSNDPDAACGYANVHDETSKRVETFYWTHHKCDDENAQTATVGRYRANGFGLYDVLGNVWEWVEDCWDRSYSGAPTDGSAAWRTGECEERVRRGGSYYNEPRFVRSANRDRAGWEDGPSGFRVARTLPLP